MQIKTNTDEQIAALLNTAIEVSQRAYVPYSNYQVGAALRAKDGTVYSGCNVENSAFSPTICAERTALVKAVSEGRQAFDLLVVVTRNGGFPCGVCRQVLYEFAPDLRVVVADLEGRVVNDLLLTDLLPHGFGPSSLE
jgi:cytidine deaminase